MRPRNPTGKNGPLDLNQPYAERSQQADLVQGAPEAGEQQTNLVLGTARRAAEQGRQQGADAAPQPVAPPEPPQPRPVQRATDPGRAIWQEVAASPGASNLVRYYADNA